MTDSPQNGYSPVLRLNLEAGGRSYAVCKAGPLRCTLREPADIPPGPAELVMRVDGQEQRWSLLLPRGASADSPTVEIDRRPS